MATLFFRNSNETTHTAVSDEHPLPTIAYGDYMPAVAGRTVTRIVEVPGVGTGSAYADGDAFGTMITWLDVFRAEKCSGTIVGAFLQDFDGEGIQIDIPIFTRTITATADNAAFAPSDIDLAACRAVVSITEFYNWGSNQFGQATGLGLWVQGEGVNLYSQCVIHGAANIASGAVPRIGLVVVPD